MKSLVLSNPDRLLPLANRPIGTRGNRYAGFCPPVHVRRRHRENVYRSKSFGNGDIPNALAAMDPNIIWIEAEGFPYADGNPYVGPQAVLERVFARIGEEWEYWNLTDIQMHEMSNNQVLSTLRCKAKYKNNGVEIDAQVAHLFTLKVRFQEFTDTGQVARAMNQ